MDFRTKAKTNLTVDVVVLGHGQVVEDVTSFKLLGSFR